MSRLAARKAPPRVRSPSPLREGIRRALADRKLELGSFKALAAELGVSETTARRMVKDGPSRRWKEADLERFAQGLYDRARRHAEARSKSDREELERRRKAPVFSLEAQQAAVRALSIALVELEKRRPCESGLWSPRVALAGELGITSVRLGRWLAAGRVPPEMMPTYVEWAQIRIDRALQKLVTQGTLERLIELAKRKEPQHQLSGADASEYSKLKPRAPDLDTSESRVESEHHSGYLWTLRVDEWSDFPLIERLHEWARTRVRPRGLKVPGRNWIVTALCNIYQRSSSWLRKGRSPGAIREFEGKTERQMGRELSLNVPVSSRTVKLGGLGRAARLWRAEMTAEHCESAYVFVQSILVRNWRNRTDEERRNYRQRYEAKADNLARLAELKRQAKRGKARSAAKKKALGRRGSAAGPGLPRKKSGVRAPAGVRPRGKKRS